MIDIPGIYVGRFKDDPNQSTMLMQIGDTPTYTDDNWANVESTGTIWRYSSETGEWIDTGLEEILVEEISGTKEIVAEGTVPWKLQGLNVYGKSTQDGTPSPDSPVPIVTAGSDGSIDITVSDGANQSQLLSIQTPNGLPGVPVDSGGNYTDADGQQWVCDEVDFQKGVYVRRTSIINYDGTEDWMTWGVNNLVNGLTGFYCYFDSGNNNNNALNTLLEQDDSVWGGGKEGFNCSSFIPGQSQYIICTLSNDILEDTSTNELAVQSWKSILANKGMTAIFTLVNPIETPLSAKELAAYAALMSYDGSTVISTDEDISGISAKVVTDVISKNAWFDPYAELALYYKALAGFESLDNLPMPHSRESSLVRKLLNSSYELGFSVNENSSRNERYLWDLINGTSTMLANVPKSDTEKFLHVMIGGNVEEYPVVDTELDYWMDKCVHYMNSNGNIGG